MRMIGLMGLTLFVALCAALIVMLSQAPGPATCADERDQGIYDVTCFRATLRDNTEDSSAVQSAINAMPATGGATLRFPYGVAVVRNLTLSGKDDITIEGPGTVRRFAAPGNVPIMQVTNSDDLTITKLRVNVNGIEMYGGITVDGSDRVRIRDTHAFDSNLNPSWIDYDHYSFVVQGGTGLRFVGNEADNVEMLELDNWNRGVVAHNRAERAAGTTAIGSFGVGNGYHLRNVKFLDNEIIDPRKYGFVIQNEGGGLSNMTVENITVARNTISHETSVAAADWNHMAFGNFTGAQSGTGNVRRNVRVIDNELLTAPNLAPRTGPALFINDPAPGQDFDEFEIRGNRVTGPRMGEWNFDLRGLTDSEVVRNVSHGGEYGIALTGVAGTRVDGNRVRCALVQDFRGPGRPPAGRVQPCQARHGRARATG
jgi:hypothetical protein